MSIHEQWVKAALQSSKYEDFGRTYQDVLALKASHNLEEALDFFPGSQARLLHFHTRDHAISIWAPLKYPNEAPIVYINGSYASFPPANLQTTASMALRPKLPPKLPPNPPTKEFNALKAPPIPLKPRQQAPEFIASTHAQQVDQYVSPGNQPSYAPPQGYSYQAALCNKDAVGQKSAPSHQWDAPRPVPLQNSMYQTPSRQFQHISQPEPSKIVKHNAPIDLMSNVVLGLNQSSEKEAALAELSVALKKCKPLADPELVFKNTQKLLSLESELRSIEEQLENHKQQMEATVDTYKSRTLAAEAVIERTDSQLVPPAWHELLTVADKPLEEARAADLAITDLFALLSKALDSGSLEIHVYLRLVRQYAREQFGHRYLLHMPPPRPPKPA